MKLNYKRLFLWFSIVGVITYALCDPNHPRFGCDGWRPAWVTTRPE